jgi:hypothetical protein
VSNVTVMVAISKTERIFSITELIFHYMISDFSEGSKAGATNGMIKALKALPEDCESSNDAIKDLMKTQMQLLRMQ